jgi:hypothetical protein
MGVLRNIGNVLLLCFFLLYFLREEFSEYLYHLLRYVILASGALCILTYYAVRNGKSRGRK